MIAARKRGWSSAESFVSASRLPALSSVEDAFDEDEDGVEPTESGVFPRDSRFAPHVDVHRAATSTLEWLEEHFALRYEGDAVLARLARTAGDPCS
jgi:hypothetical protein